MYLLALPLVHSPWIPRHSCLATGTFHHITSSPHIGIVIHFLTLDNAAKLPSLPDRHCAVKVMQVDDYVLQHFYCQYFVISLFKVIIVNISSSSLSYG